MQFSQIECQSGWLDVEHCLRCVGLSACHAVDGLLAAAPYIEAFCDVQARSGKAAHLQAADWILLKPACQQLPLPAVQLPARRAPPGGAAWPIWSPSGICRPRFMRVRCCVQSCMTQWLVWPLGSSALMLGMTSHVQRHGLAHSEPQKGQRWNRQLDARPLALPPFILHALITRNGSCCAASTQNCMLVCLGAVPRNFSHRVAKGAKR